MIVAGSSRMLRVSIPVLHVPIRLQAPLLLLLIVGLPSTQAFTFAPFARPSGARADAVAVAPSSLLLLPTSTTSTSMHTITSTSSRMISKADADELSAELAHAREVFQTFDADGSGTIGAEELGDMLSALDIDASDEEAAALFRYLDGDGTGGVTFDEFLPWYSEAAESAKQSAEVFQGIIMSRRTVDSFDKTEIDQAVVRRAIECAIAAPNRRCTEPWHFIQLGPETVAKAAALKHEMEGNEGSAFQTWTDIPGWIVVTYKRTPGNQYAQREDFKSVCCAVQNLMLSMWSEGVGTKWTDGSLQRTQEFADLVGVNTEEEKIAGIIWCKC